MKLETIFGLAVLCITLLVFGCTVDVEELKSQKKYEYEVGYVENVRGVHILIDTVTNVVCYSFYQNGISCVPNTKR